MTTADPTIPPSDIGDVGQNFYDTHLAVLADAGDEVLARIARELGAIYLSGAEAKKQRSGGNALYANSLEGEALRRLEALARDIQRWSDQGQAAIVAQLAALDREEVPGNDT